MRGLRTIALLPLRVLTLLVMFLLHLRWRLRTARGQGWRRTATVFLGPALLAGSLATAPSAHAIYGPLAGGFGANIVSVDNASDEQANAPTTDADISANGQYVVFQTKATNLFENDGETQQEKEAAEPEGVLPDGGSYRTLREGGIFRYDRETGQLQLVASGNLVMTEECKKGHTECKETDKTLVRGAQNPSVSAEGHYVAFSSAQQLVPDAQPSKTENVEVYERDMERTPGQEGAYTLVSAQNGNEEAPVYEDAQTISGGDPGAEVWPNTSISANGEYILFRTESPSSLSAGTTPSGPPDELFVRNVRTDTTTLVTRKKQGEPEEGGDAGGASGPASISADGSTVAWLGFHAPAQTVFQKGEVAEETSGPYYMWQRWREAGAKTRRITGISDPEDPECNPNEEINPDDPIATGPCYGPLTYPEASGGLSGVTPGLSANGDTVAFLANSSLREYQLKANALDLFVTSMAPGVTRKDGTSELTLAVSGAQGDGDAPITSLAISSDGTHIAFVSQRNAFVLPEPELVGSFSQEGKESELYVVDLSTDTLERAVFGLEGGELDGSVLANPTISADGSTVAFASYASNLISGDANGFSNAFTATFETPGGTAAAPAGFNVAQGGFSLTGTASPELGLSVKRTADGNLILLVETPGAGKLVAEARGTISTKAGKKTRRKKVVLAHASGATHAEGTTTLVLHLASKYAKDLKSAGKLKALVTVFYTPPPPAEALSAEASATFVAAGTKKSAKGSKESARGSKDKTKKG